VIMEEEEEDMVVVSNMLPFFFSSFQRPSNFFSRSITLLSNLIKMVVL